MAVVEVEEEVEVIEEEATIPLLAAEVVDPLARLEVVGIPSRDNLSTRRILDPKTSGLVNEMRMQVRRGLCIC